VEAWTVIGEQGQASGGEGPEPVLAAADLAAVTGWAPKPEGWCRGAECIPASLLGAVAADPAPPVEEVAAALGAAVALDAGHRISVLGHRPPAGSGPAAQDAPDVELVGLDGERHRLFEQREGKTLVVAFASWCGCRHDLPGWQALQQELAGDGLDVVAVAIDEAPDAVAHFAEVVDLPVLVDTDRRFADTYELLNVPTVFWVDEDRNVVRRPSTEFSDDAFRDFHGVASGPHLDAVRRWVREGELPGDDVPARGWTGELTAPQRQARVEFRLALELLRRGHAEPAAERIAAADALAPDDLTIWRAGMKLVGDDPFGQAFLDRYAEWQQRHGGPLAARHDAPT
jgi:peroxiredoxin